MVSLYYLLFYPLIILCDDAVKEPSRCEVCKYVATELGGKLQETGKTKEVIQTGHNILEPSSLKKIEYQKSELRLLETMEGVCERILNYNVHAERKGSFRYAKGMSETMQTLHGLKDKGVKVDLGMPYEMWDLPSAEITIMKKQCEQLLEEHEETIETWYYHHQELSLMKYLCEDRVLKADDRECLKELIWDGKKIFDKEENDAKDEQEKEKNKRGDEGENEESHDDVKDEL